MNKATEYMMAFLENNYIPLVNHHLNEDDKVYLGEKDNRTCRFCKKDKTETTFNSVAHAIPEFVGNKKLIAYYECDVCNSKFSRLMESHMGNYMNLWHTLSQVRGKKKIPSFKTTQDKSRIDIGTENVKIEDHEGDSIFTIDKEKKTITITAKRRSYVPIAIHKTLTKMALTIMPEEDLKDFKTTMAWINEEDHEKSPHDLKVLPFLMSIAPGIKPFPFVSCMLFKRKENHIDPVPHMVFLLAYGNFAFQIFLPLCSQDQKLQGGEMKLTYIPTPLDMNGIRVTRNQLDMSSKEKVKEDEESVVLQFESMEEHEIPKKGEE